MLCMMKKGIRTFKHANCLKGPDISIIEDINGGTSTEPTPVAAAINKFEDLVKHISVMHDDIFFISLVYLLPILYPNSNASPF